MSGTLAAVLLMGATLVPEGDEDLAVVRRAVAVKTAQAAPEAASKAAPPPAPKADKSPRWLKVRIMEKASKRAKVSVNLPLALVRALGDDCPIDWCRGRSAKSGECHPVRLSEVLEALESGQDIVEIDDDNATVRIWVE